MNLSLKNKSIIAIVLFVVLVAAMLLVTALTDVDLEISKILTKNALPEGEYLATDAFGVALETIGSSAVYLVAAFCIVILFWCSVRFMKLRPLREILAVIFFVGGIVAFWFYMKDILAYTGEHVGGAVGSVASDIRAGKEYAENASFTVVAVIAAIVLNLLAVAAMRGVKDETLRKLIKFVVAFVIMALLANLVVMAVKVPVGRMRYRSMNSEAGQAMGGFDNFTRWWQMTGNNDKFSKEECIAIFGATDAFKSFPSGHTCAAGMCYALIMLLDVLDVKDKRIKIAVWVGTIAMTGIVAISRIVVGAHYFSDVMMGGTLAFASMIIAREIVICKFSHIKAIFGKNEQTISENLMIQE